MDSKFSLQYFDKTELDENQPIEKELLEDYLKAVDSLTLNKINNNGKLEKEIDELREKNENNEYVIKSNLQEKDDNLFALSDRVTDLMEEMQCIKKSHVLPYRFGY